LVIVRHYILEKAASHAEWMGTQAGEFTEAVREADGSADEARKR